MIPMLVERQFSLWGSLLVVAALLVPFLIGWAVSVYENRLLWYFSEGREVLTKSNIIASVLTTTAIPCFMISFGLLGASALLGEAIGVAEIVDGTAVPSANQKLVYIPLTLVLSLIVVLPLRRLMYRAKLRETEGLGGLYLRWVTWLNVAGQLLILGFLWALLFIFPKTINVTIQ